jgi:hypothetical protein
VHRYKRKYKDANAEIPKVMKINGVVHGWNMQVRFSLLSKN